MLSHPFQRHAFKPRLPSLGYTQAGLRPRKYPFLQPRLANCSDVYFFTSRAIDLRACVSKLGGRTSPNSSNPHVNKSTSVTAATCVQWQKYRSKGRRIQQTRRESDGRQMNQRTALQVAGFSMRPDMGPVTSNKFAEVSLCVRENNDKS